MTGWQQARALVAALWLVAAGPLQVFAEGEGQALPQLPAHPAGLAWPTEQWPRGELPAGLDRAAFERGLEQLFASRGRGGHPDTRAVLFVQGGRLVYERYAEGFGPDSRFQSWSMAKSVTNAFVGLLVADGLLALDAPAPVAAWHEGDDPRHEISLRHLLQMRSGLANADRFGAEDMTTAFVSRLLFGEGALAPADHAAAVPLAHPVGEHWAYSTGTSILLAAIAGRQVGAGAEDTRDFLAARLFSPIGMRSAQPEFAAGGEFMGGSFLYATAPDWARFGYLYLRDGVWEGRRLLPAGWVDFSRTPGPAENNGVYGGHFWVNREPAAGQWELLPGAPASTFAAEGAGFQMVAIVPTLDLVAVRLGEAQGADFRELKRIFGGIVGAFPEAGGRALAEAGQGRERGPEWRR